MSSATLEVKSKSTLEEALEILENIRNIHTNQTSISLVKGISYLPNPLQYNIINLKCFPLKKVQNNIYWTVKPTIVVILFPFLMAVGFHFKRSLPCVPVILKVTVDNA